jgi:hypothetical protein
MGHGRVVAMLLAACTAGPAPAGGLQEISYTEPHEQGSDLALTQGIWDCGDMAADDATGTMTDMAHHPERQDVIGKAAGCTRTVDPDRLEEPWRVVGRIAALCEERTREKGEIVLAGGGRRMRSYVICGREAHALTVARAGVRRTVIDVVDLESYD